MWHSHSWLCSWVATLLWHRHSCLCSWVCIFLTLSSRPKWPVFSSAPKFGAPATERRDRDKIKTFRGLDEHRLSSTQIFRPFHFPRRNNNTPANAIAHSATTIETYAPFACHPIRSAKTYASGISSNQNPKKIHHGRRHGVARPIKRLQHHHSIRVPDIPVTQNPQTRSRQRHHLRVLRK